MVAMMHTSHGAGTAGIPAPVNEAKVYQQLPNGIISVLLPVLVETLTLDHNIMCQFHHLLQASSWTSGVACLICSPRRIQERMLAMLTFALGQWTYRAIFSVNNSTMVITLTRRNTGPPIPQCPQSR